MSYARFGPDSDVYVFPTGDGEGTTWITCQHCSLMHAAAELDDDYIAPDATLMLIHLKAHQAAGHKVPQAALDRLDDEVGTDV